MKKLSLLLLIFVMANIIAIQKVAGQGSANTPATTANKQHKVVFQLSSEDTLLHKSLMKQLNNIITVVPNSKIEVVCHGPGLNMLISGKTTVQEKINQLKKKNIVFVACEFSMSERNIPKEKIIPEAGLVPYAIIEIVSKQEEGWSYIKPGF